MRTGFSGATRGNGSPWDNWLCPLNSPKSKAPHAKWRWSLHKPSSRESGTRRNRFPPKRSGRPRLRALGGHGFGSSRRIGARRIEARAVDGVTSQLKARAVTVKTGTLVDATAITSASHDDAEAAWSRPVLRRYRRLPRRIGRDGIAALSCHGKPFVRFNYPDPCECGRHRQYFSSIHSAAHPSASISC
jgi:hypothetical protein